MLGACADVEAEEFALGVDDHVVRDRRHGAAGEHHRDDLPVVLAGEGLEGLLLVVGHLVDVPSPGAARGRPGSNRTGKENLPRVGRMPLGLKSSRLP
jgi:hypothetical protein